MQGEEGLFRRKSPSSPCTPFSQKASYKFFQETVRIDEISAVISDCDTDAVMRTGI